MADTKERLAWAGFIISVVALPLGIFQETFNFRNWLGLDLKVSRQTQFTCKNLPDPNRGSGGSEVWSVRFEAPRSFREAPRSQTWLRIVEEMGGDWNEATRCYEIADRLNNYAPDGLLGFYYRKAENLENQYVICAETELVPRMQDSDCPIVVTLMPKADPHEALQNVAGALMPNGDAAYQCANNDQSRCRPQDIAYIPVSID
ncbi:MAG: COP23 domain-containing protein [Prochlorotrichaceae cyanobacterium]|jgi:hypothetical protein